MSTEVRYTDPPQSRNEAILKATIEGTEYTDPPQSRIEDLLLDLKEVIEEGGGGGGTTVVPNPTGTPTDTLDTVKIGSTIYDIPEGAEVEANPQETASETLSKIGIDGTVYSVPNGGSGTSDYTDLSNKPQINSNTLTGNQSGADLGLVDAETGKGLSTNDFTDAFETKLNGIAAGAEVNVQADWNETDTDSDAYIQNKPTIPASQVNSDWNASSGVAEILHKPTLGTAAAKDSTNAVTANSTDLVESGAVKTAIDNAVASAYHAAGTAVVADLTSSLLIATNEGNVYNMTDAGTTTADFIEGAGKPIKIGDNVGICKVGNAYKFDLLSGFVDTSNFIEKSSTAGLVKNDGTIDTKTYAESANAYQTGDTAETTLDDADYFPFYDSSASAKRKTPWSNIKSVLKTYFDTLYSTVTERKTPASGGTTLSLVNTGDMYSWNNKADKVSGATTGDFAALGANGNLTDSGKKASDFSKVSIATDGTAAYNATQCQKITIDGTDTAIDGTKFLETQQKNTLNGIDTFSFQHADISSSNLIDYEFSTDALSAYPVDVQIGNGTMDVKFYSTYNVTICRVYIRG